MSAQAADERLRRFLQPRHAAYECAIIQWQGIGEADTPGADAVCRVHLALDGPAQRGIAAAAFAAFGPPEVFACADWLCERLEGRTIDAARGLSPRELEQALALPAEARYAALLAIDALANALADLGK